ncbi:MAG: Uma2 family endonuclease [Saprospiraceae bacterium]|nr:Uma2 family endonuclease [Saprospiraceae bacterium]
MVEIIRGKLFRMSPAPKTKHQIISSNLHFRLRQLLENKICSVFHAPIDVVLPIENKKRTRVNYGRQPDICVICDPKIIEENAVFGTPNFIIEIIAGKDIKGTHKYKYSVYEEAGVGGIGLYSGKCVLLRVFIRRMEGFHRFNAFLRMTLFR